MLEKIREAIYFYTQPDIWVKIQRNGMTTDNSWSAAANKYLELYREMTGIDQGQIQPSVKQMKIH
jgi:glycogen synthase